MSAYEKWLHSEKVWIGRYCNAMMRTHYFLTAPLVVGFMTVFVLLLGVIDGRDTDYLMQATINGFLIGLVIALLYLFFASRNMRPTLYTDQIRRSVRNLNLSQQEKELLGQEFLAAMGENDQQLAFSVGGPTRRPTPAKFTVTPHYALLLGEVPFANLIPLGEMAAVEQQQEEQLVVTRGAKLTRSVKATRYALAFYRKDRFERGLQTTDAPDVTMLFWDGSIANRALQMLKSQTHLTTTVEL